MLTEPNINIRCITVAHEYTLTERQRCDYSDGRRVCGLCYAISGEAIYKFSTGEKHVFREGDVYYLPESLAYVAYSQGEYVHLAVNFSLCEPIACDLLPSDRITVLRSAGTKRYEADFRALVDIWNRKELGYSVRALGCAYSIMADFLSELGERRSATVGVRRLMPAKEYVDRRYTEPISLAQLASLCGMSETNFRREFLKAFRQTPMQYRDALRIRRSKELLSSGFYGVGEVADAVGIDNLGYFCRFFKRWVGMTPSDYAKTSV